VSGLPDGVISLPGGRLVHRESVAGKAFLQAEAEIEAEEHRARVEREKNNIRIRKARPWWKRWLPFYITIRFHWNWRN